MRISLPIIIFVLIILSASYFRLAFIDLAEFKGDEARDAFVVKNFAQNGTIPLVGAPTTVGGNLGAIYYFILTPAFMISANPIAASAFVAVLNVVGIVLTFKFAKDFFNERVALIASALAAVSPLAIIYSRKIWNPDLLFPFSVIVLYSLYSFAIRRKPKFLIPFFIGLAVIIQLHATALSILFVIPIFLFKFRSTIEWKYFAVGIISAFVLISPFLYSELTNNFHNTETLISTSSFFQLDKINTIAIQHLASLTSGTDFDFILGDSSQLFHNSILNIQKLFFIENLLLFFGFVLIIYSCAKKFFSTNLKYSILLLWTIFPILFLLFFTGPQYPQNLLVVLPANFLAVAILFDFLLKKTPSLNFGNEMRLLIIFCLLFVLSLQIIFDQAFLNFLNKYGGTPGFYEVGVKYKIDLVKYVADNSPANFSISYSLQPNDIGLEYKYLLSLYGKNVSDSPSVKYIVVDSLSQSNMNLLSNYQHVNFGPLTLYILR